ncbi:MAG: 2-amino-4-hydroxy-6-hydroxymethyldihydropteridine diphosphokinase [Bacteroidota bacterium]
MSETYLLLGGNIGDTKAILKDAIKVIESSSGIVLKKSSVYKSEAWGFKSEQAFLNQVILLQTKLSPEVLLHTILSIEQQMGRERDTNEGYSSRLIDIDILFYDNLIINQESLTVPHPLLHKRRFTLLPLNEIAKDYIHPILNKSINELLLECPDDSIVNLYE